jgi:hypothetical protein
MKEIDSLALFGPIAILGCLIVLIEAFFTHRYLATRREEKEHVKYSLSEHILNHLFYPFITFFALCFYFLIQTNTSLSYLIIGLSFFMYGLYLYYLPIHLHYDHSDYHLAKTNAVKVEFILYLFKFLSYFIVNLAIFIYYFLGEVDFNVIIVLNFLTNFLYLFFHIFRRKDFKFINILMALIFAGFTTLFTVSFKASYINLSASIATLFFYITSSVFYHKIDGTFNYKVMAEYGSIALIASILLFSI